MLHFENDIYMKISHFEKDIYTRRGEMGKHSGFKIPRGAIKRYLHLSESQGLLYIGAVPHSKIGSTKRNGQRVEDYLTFVKEKCQCESKNISGRMILGKRI